MKSFHDKLIRNKYRSILYIQSIFCTVLILYLVFNKNKQENSEILNNFGILSSIGYLSIFLYPVFLVQSKIAMLILKDYRAIPSPIPIYNAIHISLFYLSIFSGALFLVSSFYEFEITPAFFSIPGCLFVFALISDRCSKKTGH